uniref:Uperin-2.4 n=1 Tax=Uperoleia inundata TaxID=104953 RepID=UPE24_UPEIN|nr:RecName: Full=Uperin-2.4 [Uperoleia inundata]
GILDFAKTVVGGIRNALGI